VNEVEAVNYLLSNYHEWRKHYSLFTNHWAAMTVVAGDLSKHCDLNVYADSIWIGGGFMGLGMVFKGVSMGEKARTPEDDEKLKKLEERLVELKFVTTPKLEILCSHSFLPHLNEPMEMAMLPGPTGERQATRIVGLTRYWRPGGKHDRQRQRKRKARRERGGAKTR